MGELIRCEDCEGAGFEIKGNITQGPDGPIDTLRRVTCIQCNGSGKINGEEKISE